MHPDLITFITLVPVAVFTLKSMMTSLHWETQVHGIPCSLLPTAFPIKIMNTLPKTIEKHCSSHAGFNLLGGFVFNHSISVEPDPSVGVDGNFGFYLSDPPGS